MTIFKQKEKNQVVADETSDLVDKLQTTITVWKLTFNHQNMHH